MSVKKNRPTLEEAAETLIAKISNELDADSETVNADAPEIVEDYAAYSNRFSVRVVWDLWQNLPPAERVPIILAAYARSNRAAEKADITSVRGLTPLEARQEEILATRSEEDAPYFLSEPRHMKGFMTAAQVAEAEAFKSPEQRFRESGKKLTPDQVALSEGFK